MRVAYLTTTDNPYDPHLQFDQWKQYDERNGYYSCSLLARLAPVSDELSITDYNEIVEHTIDSIIQHVPTGRENVKFSKRVCDVESAYDEKSSS